MGRPEGVSEDLWQSVMATARSVGDEVTFGSYEQNVLLIARTLAAERLACANTGYQACAETRHVTLGDRVSQAIRSRP